MSADAVGHETSISVPICIHCIGISITDTMYIGPLVSTWHVRAVAFLSQSHGHHHVGRPNY
eukprot:COSAG05_NODE_18801_length_302_cov_1.280788_1_plen_60_part_01